jgi:hypothetical protein
MTFAPSSTTSINSDMIFKVKEETDEIALPFSPESLPVTPSHTISDVDEDSDSTFVSALNNSNYNIIANAGRQNNNSSNLRSPVASRFRGPAEPTNDLQPQEQNRVPAVERRRTTTSSTLPCHSALLIWIHLLGPLHVTSSHREQKLLLKTESMEARCLSMKALMIPLLEFNLPPKKRSHWWGAHRPSPHAKT